jgi:LacI family transcriptional regulator
MPDRRPGLHPPRVCLALPRGNSYCRGVLEGLATFVQQHGPWLTVSAGRLTRASQVKQTGRVDGWISLQVDDAVFSALEQTGKPVVFVESGREDQHSVVPDESALGRLAVEHFRDLGLRRVAFFSGEQTRFGMERRASFLAHARKLGLEIRDNLQSQPRSFHRPDARRRWLASIPEQTGLFLVTSGWGGRILTELADLGRAVPEDLAVLTAEFSRLDARLCWPALSSVDQATGRIGFEAGRLLSRLLAGRSLAPRKILVPPSRICRRASTDILAIEDPHVRRAVEYIRRCATDGIGVADVLRRVVVSRRKLEQQFQRCLGRTIHKEIIRRRLNEAQRLLAETSLPLADIAVRVGYEHASNLCKVLRRELGVRPSALRSWKTS